MLVFTFLVLCIHYQSAIPSNYDFFLRTPNHIESKIYTLIVVVRPTVVVVEIEHTGCLSVVEIASTFEEWIHQVRKVRVVQFNPRIYLYLLPLILYE